MLGPAGFDRRWLDALWAEMSAMPDRRERLSWLMGAADLLCAYYLRAFAPVLICGLSGAGTAVFAVLALSGYESPTIDDDWYATMSAAFAAAFSFMAALLWKRGTEALRR
jgi:hypothetical protein